MAYFVTKIQIQIPLRLTFSLWHGPKLFVQKTWMSISQGGKSMRPNCPSCSKPTRTCLCSRILTTAIPNSVNVTILQHALECKHPLNSARIARLGLKNLTITTVSDVNFEARFLIQLLDPTSHSSLVNGNVSNCLFSDEFGETLKLFSGKDSNLIDSAGLNNDVNKVSSISDVVDVNVQVEKNPLQQKYGLLSNEIAETQTLFSVKDSNFINNVGLNNDVTKVSIISDGVDVNDQVEKNPLKPNSDDLCRGVHEENGGHAITVTIGKYGAISSLSHIWMQQSQSPNLSFEKILSCPEAFEALSKGFLVKKLQRKQLMYREVNMEEYEEFELEVPPGSVLLFPSDKAVSIGDLDDIGFEVKNLIVLDGTWAKAKRIFSENPWLNILPHLKLEVNKGSLYSDVRRQPKAGYLSTIESVVFTLKAVGENHEGLDNLLDTFESMVGDQRRCREERLSKLFLS